MRRSKLPWRIGSLSFITVDLCCPVFPFAHPAGRSISLLVYFTFLEEAATMYASSIPDHELPLMYRFRKVFRLSFLIKPSSILAILLGPIFHFNFQLLLSLKRTQSWLHKVIFLISWIHEQQNHRAETLMAQDAVIPLLQSHLSLY